jgi:hypothetical protein
MTCTSPRVSHSCSFGLQRLELTGAPLFGASGLSELLAAVSIKFQPTRLLIKLSQSFLGTLIYFT